MSVDIETELNEKLHNAGISVRYFAPSRRERKLYIKKSLEVGEIATLKGLECAPLRDVLRARAIADILVSVPNDTGAKDSSVGTAFCSPHDTPNYRRGVSWATARALYSWVVNDQQVNMNKAIAKLKDIDPAFCGEVECKLDRLCRTKE